MRTRRFDAPALFTLAVISVSEGAFGQANSGFEVFRRPAETAGHCEAATQPHVGAPTGRSYRLVLKSLPPGDSREMMAIVDESTRAIGYVDMSFVMTSERTGMAINVIAFLDSLGRPLESSWTGITVAYPESVKSLRNVPALRSMSERSIISQTRRLLTTEEVDSVRSLVRYLRERCPS